MYGLSSYYHIVICAAGGRPELHVKALAGYSGGWGAMGVGWGGVGGGAGVVPYEVP